MSMRSFQLFRSQLRAWSVPLSLPCAKLHIVKLLETSTSIKPASTIHSPTGCTMHQLQSKKPCSWWSKCANAWCKWPCAHAHTWTIIWTIATHHRTTELSRDMRKYDIRKGLVTCGNPTISNQYAGRWLLLQSNLQVNSHDESSPLKQKALGVATMHLQESLKIFSLKTMPNHFQYCQLYQVAHWCEVVSDAHACMDAAIQNCSELTQAESNTF